MDKGLEKLLAIAVIGFIAFQVFGGQKAPAPSTTVITPSGGSGDAVDLCKLVDGQISFTGQRMFLSGTALTNEWVRVIRIGSKMDLGLISENSGTVSVTPNANYKLYYGENSTTYYTVVEDYKAPCQDSADNKVGVECLIDTAPTTTTFDENGQVMTATQNGQAIGASEVVDMEFKVKVAADSCYGNPQSPVKNAVCFDYNSTVFDSIKANTPSIKAPYSISAAKTAGLAQACYELNLLKDTESQVLTITFDATATQPTSDHNVTVSIEDVDVDLNQDTLEEIWGFEDETNTNLGDGINTDVFYVT